MHRILPLLLACLALPGCGAELREPGDPFAVEPPRGERSETLGSARFERPANWSFSRDAAPRLFTLRSGEALVVAWAYARSEPLPEPGPAVERARRSLVEEVRRRDPAFELAGSRVLEVADAPAVEVTGSQTISRRELRVRSVHVYRGGFEIVIEALAPEESFERVDRQVLQPLLRSLRIG